MVSEFILVDISNSFTKVAFSNRRRLGRVFRFPTASFTAKTLSNLMTSHRALRAVVASVVPSKNSRIQSALPKPVCWVNHQTATGIGITYPKPETIGADRLANAVAAKMLFGAPAVVVDFGTAVTFDVISSNGNYCGGVIAPGLAAMTDYLHRNTALLPRVALRKPSRAIGRSTEEAMRSGAIHGYRGLISEILRQVLKELNCRKKVLIIATGGDAKLIGADTRLFDIIDPRLTLEGLRLIGCRNFPRQALPFAPEETLRPTRTGTEPSR